MAATSTPPIHPMPFTRLELAVFAVREGTLQVLLARRAEAPHAGRGPVACNPSLGGESLLPGD